jgi:ubiquinone/menaquinone biosynthesis C-methylase UbiE
VIVKIRSGRKATRSTRSARRPAIDWKRRDAEWDIRVKQFGLRGVYHVGNPESNLSAVDEMQRREILPLFRQQIRPTDRTALDFGCGWGRWTATIAAEIGGTCVGVEPTVPYLEEARRRNAGNPAVSFTHLFEGRIPENQKPVDIVWACIALSTILDPAMFKLELSEIDRILKPGGLMFLIDNTDGTNKNTPVRSRWSISRTIAEYKAAFAPFVKLHVIGEYKDLGEPDTIFAGSKCRPS